MPVHCWIAYLCLGISFPLVLAGVLPIYATGWAAILCIVLRGWDIMSRS